PYGMAEIVAAASECESGSLHQWPEVGRIEVLHDDSDERAEGGGGRLSCTGLLNADMPLVRYAIGDRGALVASDPVCRCGRALARLAAIDGRSDDVILTPDG